MNRIVIFFAIAIFSVFLGSQITEGLLLVPYWKSLTSTKFYEYYSEFGPIINTFYSILTIIAILIPINLSVYSYIKKLPSLKYSIISSIFSLLILVIFYVYFKDTNQQFFNTSFTVNELKSVLIIWEYLHWLRIFFETIALTFLILALAQLSPKNYIKS
ncbi:hypothetical protein [Tenacibaculum soleae]|uniref:hypothetical protein n=1 Tax=Tenacibaculum soleae TaxID=447689 RepID=UPI002300DF08|nr:hypothetical protein [Tenacibaculum soleae]